MGPYKWITTSFDRGWTFRPFVVVPKINEVDGWSNQQQAYIDHEMTHWGRQKSFFYAIWWIIKYFTNKKFRFQEEGLAYTKQIESLLVQNPWGFDYYVKEKATSMSTQYWGMCTLKEATDYLVANIKK